LVRCLCALARDARHAEGDRTRKQRQV